MAKPRHPEIVTVAIAVNSTKSDDYPALLPAHRIGPRYGWSAP
ncbi:hypothetical protein [uncultured Jannaschia sp.]|nr:hypothetical protein [uncultured Jannaschia sp.]